MWVRKKVCRSFPTLRHDCYGSGGCGRGCVRRLQGYNVLNWTCCGLWFIKGFCQDRQQWVPSCLSFPLCVVVFPGLDRTWWCRGKLSKAVQKGWMRRPVKQFHCTLIFVCRCAVFLDVISSYCRDWGGWRVWGLGNKIIEMEAVF